MGREIWKVSEKNCTILMKWAVQLTFSGKWTSARKARYRRKLKAAIEKVFNGSTIRVKPTYPVCDNSSFLSEFSENRPAPCKCPCYPKGFTPSVSIVYRSSNVDWKVEVQSGSSAGKPPTEGRLFETSVTDQHVAGPKDSGAPLQNPASHEFGHSIGLEHPGYKISKKKLDAQGVDEYTWEGKDHQGNDVGPADVMGYGMDLRAFYFNKWWDELNRKYCDGGCDYQAK